MATTPRRSAPLPPKGFWANMKHNLARLRAWVGLRARRALNWLRGPGARRARAVKNYVATKSRLFWLATKRVARRVPTNVRRTVAWPLRLLSSASMQIIAASVLIVMLVLAGTVWVTTKYDEHVHERLVIATMEPGAQMDDEAIDYEKDVAAEIISVAVNDHVKKVTSLDSYIGADFSFRETLGVDGEQEVVTRIFAKDPTLDVSLNTLSDDDRWGMLNGIFRMLRELDEDKQVTAEWFGRFDCLSSFLESPETFFEDDMGVQQDAESKRWIAQRDNNNKAYSFMHAPAFKTGWATEYNRLRDKHLQKT